MLVLRPLGGADDDIAAVFPGFEDGRRRPVRAARPPTTSATQHAAGLLRTALRIGFRSGAGPVPLARRHRRRAARLPARAAADGAAPGHRPAADRRRRRHRQDRRGRPDRHRAARPGRAPSGLAVLCSPGARRAVAGRAAHQVRHRRRAGAALHRRAAWSAASTWASRSSTGTRTSSSPPTSSSRARHRDDFVRHCPDLVIVDEAHTCVAADDDRRPAQSQLRYELLQRVAADADRHLLLVTATPHSGKESAFRNLLGLLDPELATRRPRHRRGPAAARRALRAAQARRHPPVPRPRTA